MKHLRAIHLIAGLFGFAIFLASGQYMHFAYDHLRGMEQTPRLLFRSAHIYLLFCALLNIMLGLYASAIPTRSGRTVQTLGSVSLLVSLVLMACSFFTESLQHELHRPLARQAIYLALLGVLLHLVAVLSLSRKPLQ
jgi:hypothetical protein